VPGTNVAPCPLCARSRRVPGECPVPFATFARIADLVSLLEFIIFPWQLHWLGELCNEHLLIDVAAWGMIYCAFEGR
jgi:hypothetical protein